MKNITYHESLHFFSATPVIEYKGLAAKKNGLELDLESGNDKIESICKTIEEFILQIDQKNVNN